MGLKQYYAIFENLNLNLPKCNHSKCYRGYNQTFILLKIHAEMVENNTLKAKYPILAIFRKCHKWGTKCCIDLHLQFLLCGQFHVKCTLSKMQLSPFLLLKLEGSF